jgi:hypothetical protein
MQLLSEEFVEEFEDKIDWELVITFNRFRESFLRKNIDKLNIDDLCLFQTLSEDFITQINRHHVSTYQKLSEKFIEEFKENLDFYSISTHQELSEDFIWKYREKLLLCRILHHQNISVEFARRLVGSSVRLLNDYKNTYDEPSDLVKKLISGGK